MFGYKFITEEDLIRKDVKIGELQRRIDNLEHGIKEILGKQAIAHTLEIGYKINEDGTIKISSKEPAKRRNAQNGRFVKQKGVLYELT